MLKTPLHDEHLQLGARMVPFGGWSMPVQYRGILDEARHVRAHCGLFDLCHMGRFRCTGPGAEALLQRVVTNDVTKIKPGVIRYALLTKEDGGVLDDVLVYRDPVHTDGFFVVVNAGNRDRDRAWIEQHAKDFDCDFEDRSDALAMIALQGPASEAILNPLCSTDLSELGYYKWTHAEACGLEASISRTGYTGEDGFELYFDAAKATEVWRQLLESGAADKLEAIGLGARDTLRLEAGMALYGHELDEETNPYEAGLSWAVKLKSGFIGAEALAKVKADGPARELIGIETESRRVPRQGYEIVKDGEVIGSVASGTFSPVRERNIATAFVQSGRVELGDTVHFRIRDKDEAASVCALPFYKRS